MITPEDDEVKDSISGGSNTYVGHGELSPGGLNRPAGMKTAGAVTHPAVLSEKLRQRRP